MKVGYLRVCYRASDNPAFIWKAALSIARYLALCLSRSLGSRSRSHSHSGSRSRSRSGPRSRSRSLALALALALLKHVLSHSLSISLSHSLVRSLSPRRRLLSGLSWPTSTYLRCRLLGFSFCIKDLVQQGCITAVSFFRCAHTREHTIKRELARALRGIHHK